MNYKTESSKRNINMIEKNQIAYVVLQKALSLWLVLNNIIQNINVYEPIDIQ